MSILNDIDRNKMFLFLIAQSAYHTIGPAGLLVRDEPIRRIPRPSIWSLYRPVDITLYDLLYADEIYPNHPDQSDLYPLDLYKYNQKNYWP